MRFWTTIGLIFLLSALGLTYEIAAGRVLAPFFGTSLLTWTSVSGTAARHPAPRGWRWSGRPS